jgi:hypothetical protein
MEATQHPCTQSKEQQQQQARLIGWHSCLSALRHVLHAFGVWQRTCLANY